MSTSAKNLKKNSTRLARSNNSAGERPRFEVRPGKPYPLGATWQGDGVNFAVYSEAAKSVELCLFDATGREEIGRLPLMRSPGYVWHGFIPRAKPDQVYGYRARGEYAPKTGHRFNHHKFLLDPYAKSHIGELHWGNVEYGYRIGTKQEWRPDTSDSQHAMPKCAVVDPTFSWGDERRPNTPWENTVIYELHVKGFTQLHPLVPEELRGKYLGLTTAPVIDYLRNLGVTAVELLPCQAYVSERLLHDKGLKNYWGYNPISFFAPSDRYAIDDPVVEFKSMVKGLHDAGLEVLMDIVFNHTAEGNDRGPTLSFRGLDNKTYYHLDPTDERKYLNYSGCGNTFNADHPQALTLIMDSLRYWVEEMHVDGFRFDLAACLGRENDVFNSNGKFFGAIRQDPVLSKIKLIAEPWDLGHDGYQLGKFPLGWSEWNDQYRDTVRGYWRGEGGRIGPLAQRISGSSDLFQPTGRQPTASINYICVHDGFTLHDLVSYQKKRNEKNLEDNEDGETNNVSWNCGVEGPTDDAYISTLRLRQKRNFLATLFLSQGVPMIQAGDERGRTQDGNNNAYCQDNETSWLNWELSKTDADLLAFTKGLIHLRREHPVLRQARFLTGDSRSDGGLPDVAWYRPDGQPMEEHDWKQWYARCLGVLFNGNCVDGPNRDASFFLIFNSHKGEVPFTLPEPVNQDVWEIVFDTSTDKDFRRGTYLEAGYVHAMHPRSVLALVDRRVELG